jgi:hypothetical protein
MQRLIDRGGVWEDRRNLRIKHYDVRACPNPLVVFTALKLLEVRAFVLRAKLTGCGLNLLHKCAFQAELRYEG